MKILILIMIVLISVLVWTQFHPLQNAPEPSQEKQGQDITTDLTQTQSSRKSGASVNPQVRQVSKGASPANRVSSSEAYRSQRPPQLMQQSGNSSRYQAGGNRPGESTYNQNKYSSDQSYKRQPDSETNYAANTASQKYSKAQQSLAYKEGRMNSAVAYDEYAGNRNDPGPYQKTSPSTGSSSISAYQGSVSQQTPYQQNQGTNSLSQTRTSVNPKPSNQQASGEQAVYRETSEAVDCTYVNGQRRCR